MQYPRSESNGRTKRSAFKRANDKENQAPLDGQPTEPLTYLQKDPDVLTIQQLHQFIRNNSSPGSPTTSESEIHDFFKSHFSLSSNSIPVHHLLSLLALGPSPCSSTLSTRTEQPALCPFLPPGASSAQALSRLLCCLIDLHTCLGEFKHSMLRSTSGFDFSAVFNSELDVKKKGGFGRSSLRHYLVRRWAEVRAEFLEAVQRLVGQPLASVDVLSD